MNLSAKHDVTNWGTETAKLNMWINKILRKSKPRRQRQVRTEEDMVS